MEFALLLAAFVMGIVIGAVGRPLLFRATHTQDNQKQLEHVTLELTQYRQEVSDRFVEHYQQLASLTEQINKLNANWNLAANQLTLDADDEIKHLPQLVPHSEREQPLPAVN
ncbi:DUF1043 family protein [Shewanella sp. SNU WT4]|uniref:ZapG family protein n=1 Tax=Shewanella sp. SNU WT4 TaxID=2590015 RepID=UPI001128A035|nr:DUF1043 family protein [Shewanella sp. SNU WT4]QDF66014.1 DUF1043 family protein [Shewanella sp. SNU WT4]